MFGSSVALQYDTGVTVRGRHQDPSVISSPRSTEQIREAEDGTPK